MSRQMREDLSEDPFHMKPGTIPNNMGMPPNQQFAAAAYQQQLMSNTAAMMNNTMGGAMYAANAAMMHNNGQMPMMNPQGQMGGLLNTNGMAQAPTAALPQSRFKPNFSNHSTPNNVRGGPQGYPAAGRGVQPYGMNPANGGGQYPGGQGHAYSGMPRPGGGGPMYGSQGMPGGGMGHPPPPPPPPSSSTSFRPQHMAPTRPLPGTGLPSKPPGSTMTQAPTSKLPPSRR